MDRQKALGAKGKRAMNRRRFLSTCAAGTACLAAAPLARFGSALPNNQAGRPRIRVIYSLHAIVQPTPDWPNIGFDFGPVMERFNNLLTGQCPEFEFLFSLAKDAAEAANIVAADKQAAVDGYLVYQMNCWNPVVQTIAATGKPVLYADFQFAGSGGFLVYTADFLRKKTANLGFVASSRPADLVAAVKCFSVATPGGAAADFAAAVTRERIRRTPAAGDLSCLADGLKAIPAAECLSRMRESKILAVRDQESGLADPIMEIALERVSFAEVNDAWKGADKDEARAIADRWQKSAAAVIGVSRETLENSAAMYLGMKSVLKKHAANAITMNCLGGFYGGHIHAYPCLGFFELNNEGLIGACECDIRSTAAMVAFAAMTRGRPGYISDPVIDTAKRQIIYAHCVASNRVFGPGGRANPFAIMTHSEDRQGASVRSVLPVGYLTTTLEIKPDTREILLHQAKAVSNDPDDRACRTKMCAEPLGDIEKLFRMWDQWGWHRVTFYGDLKKPAYDLAEAIGWKVIEEA